MIKFWHISNVLLARLRKRIPYKELYIYELRKRCKYVGEGLKVNKRCLGFGNNVTLGDFVNFNGCTIHGSGEFTVGRYFHSGDQLKIFTSDHKYKEADAIPYDAERIISKVIIEDFVWVGWDVTIMPGVILGEGCIVAAGSVVTKSVESLSIVGGNPAKVIGYRDEISFNYLKMNKKFF